MKTEVKFTGHMQFSGVKLILGTLNVCALVYWCFRELQNVFHIGDRVAIYIFIASSYTPW